MGDNYSQLLDRIAHAAKIGVGEVERKVEAKRAKLSGLVSKEGAAQIVAAELGLNFDKERMKISELLHGMKRANVVGKILQIAPVRSYNKNGREGKVARLIVADESGNVPVVLWDTNHIGLVEQQTLKLGECVEISNASVRNGELHLSSFGDIKHSTELLDNVITAKSFQATKFKEAKPGMGLKTRAFIVQTFEPRYFEICPECRKKAVEGMCVAHGKVEAQKRALLTFVLDDGSESMRSIAFGDQLLKLGLSEEEIFSLEKFATKKESLIGEEKVFSGNIRANKLYNTIEFNVESVENVDPEQLIRELEHPTG